MRGMVRCFFVLSCQQLQKIKIRTYSVSNKLQETTCGCYFFPWNRVNRCRCHQAKKEPLERERMEEEWGQWFVMPNPKQAICPAVATEIAVWKLHETPLSWICLRCFLLWTMLNYHQNTIWNKMFGTFSKHRTRKIQVIWRYHSLSFCIMKTKWPMNINPLIFQIFWLFHRDLLSLYIMIISVVVSKIFYFHPYLGKPTYGPLVVATNLSGPFRWISRSWVALVSIPWTCGAKPCWRYPSRRRLEGFFQLEKVGSWKGVKGHEGENQVI